MARRRKRRTSPWTAVPVWTLVLALVAWGVWQALSLRRALLADAGAVPATEPAPAVVAPGNTVTDIEPADADFPDPNDTPAPAINAIPDSPPVPILTPEERAHQLADLLARADSNLETSNIIEARSALNQALTIAPEGTAAEDLRSRLADLNAATLLGTAVLPDDPVAHYIDIQAGDNYGKLGVKYAVPADFLARINPTLNPRIMRTGAGMKIVEGPFTVRFIRHASRLDLFVQNIYVKSYPAVVEDGDVLPHGTYRVKPASKIQVGSRFWIGFQAADKITPEVENAWIYGSTGPRRSDAPAETSAGLKLRDPDLAELYNLLVETKSLIRVDP